MASSPLLNSGISEKVRHRFPPALVFRIFGLACGVVFILYTLAYLGFNRLDPQLVVSSIKASTGAGSGGTLLGQRRTIAVQDAERSRELIWDHQGYNDEVYGLTPEQSFHTTALRAPLFQVNTFKPEAKKGERFLFFTPQILDQAGIMAIYSRRDLSPVYLSLGSDEQTLNNFRPQKYNGQTYLSFWDGFASLGHGLGHGILMNNQYEVTHNISIGYFDSEADSHEYQLTHDGGALFTIFEAVPNFDLSLVGGPVDGVLQDSCFEEVDIRTGQVRFHWRASDWYNVTGTQKGYADEDYGHPTPEGGWDFFHLNSIDKTQDGNYLISGRLHSVLALIDGTTGEPIWTIGGEFNQYRDLSDGRTAFRYQHHARFVDGNQNEVVLFDNSQMVQSQPTPGCQLDCSRGLHLRMDHVLKTVELVREYHHPYSVQVRAEGSAEKQPNGNVLVGWGKAPGFTEFTEDGDVVLDVQTGPLKSNMEEDNAHIYRIFSADWQGSPVWDPEIALFEGDLYVSWNGATEQAFWALYLGDAVAQLQVDRVVRRGGFETRLSLPQDAPRLARVLALDMQGNLIGATDVIDTHSGKRTPVAQPGQLDFRIEPRTLWI